MYFPHRKILFLIVVVLTGLAAILVPIAGNAQNTSPQRLRIRVDHRKLESGQETKVIVEFLDMNYNKVANDAKREIVIGKSSAGSKQTGDGYVKPDRFWIEPGEWSREATFVSNHSGRLFITAESRGLEPARTLVLITERTASFLSRLLETVAYAQEDEPLVISPSRADAKANNKDFAAFQVSFLENPAPGTILKIKTNLTDGRILYKGELKGSSIAEIRLDGENGVTDDIQISSAKPGPIEVVASVERFRDTALVDFEKSSPSKLLFDDAPKTIPSEAAEVCVMARLYDDSPAVVKTEQDRNVRFRAAKDSDKISFDPESVKIPAGQDFAETRLKLTSLPSGNRISIIATSEGVQSAEKSIPIQSSVQKLLVTGPREVKRGQEVEFTVQLAKHDGAHCEADLDRTIDISTDGGSLAKTQLIIPRGQRQGSIKYTAPTETGSYTLTAFSSDMEKGSFPVTVVYPGYLLILLSLFGSFVGGVTRHVQDASCKKIAPRLFYRRWDVGRVGWLIGSLAGGLFLYWAIKLGFGSALSSPLPDNLDLGSKTTAFFFGGIGGFAGTVVLDLLASVLMPALKRHSQQKQPAASAAQ